MNKAIWVGMLSVAIYYLSGCMSVSDSGPSSKLTVFGSRIISLHAPESANYTEVIDESTAIPIADFMLEIKAVHHTQIEVARNKPIRFKLINDAMASTPASDLADTSVYNLTITSSSDFSSEYPAGSILNDLFEIEYVRTGRGGNSSWSHYDAPLGYVQNLYGKSIEEYLAGDNYMMLHMQLKLKKAPLSVEQHVFHVVVNHFSLESNPVKLITSEE